MQDLTPYIAHHEAGHAVASWLVGDGALIQEIRVSPHHGQVTYTSSLANEIDLAGCIVRTADGWKREVARERLCLEIICCLSGPAAAWKYSGGSRSTEWLEHEDAGGDALYEGASEDAKLAICAAANCTGGDITQAQAVVEQYAAVTTELIWLRRVWRVIEAVASELVTRNKIPGAHAMEVMAARWGRKPHAFPASQLGEKWRGQLFAKTQESVRWRGLAVDGSEVRRLGE